MRNYRTISSPDSWTYVFVKNLSEGADADKPNLSDGFGFPAYALGLGYRSSDKTLWGVTDWVTKYDSATGQELDSWGLYGTASGAEIDGDNDDWLWVTTRFDAVAKYSLSKRTDVAEVTYFHIAQVGGTNYTANGICAPAGEYIYIGVMSNTPIVRKIRKADGAIIADYPVPFDPSDLAWDGTNIWVSYEEQSIIDCYNPIDFTLVKSINSPYPSNQGLTFDGEGLWVSYAYLTDDNGIIAKLGETGGGSPVKMYYATDTETLYWNVGGQWQDVPKGADNFLGLMDSPDTYTGQLGKMLVVNTTEDGLELVSPPEPTSIAKSGAAAMSGDILIEAGDNVTITQDDTAKKIVISAAALEPPPATAGVSSISAMTGDIIIEAGENVTVTEDTTNKKIIIAAAALEPPPATAGVTSISAMTGDIIIEAGNNVTITQDDTTKKIIISASAGSGGGSGASKQWMDYFTLNAVMSTTAILTKGSVFEPTENITIFGISSIINITTAQTAKIGLYEVDITTNIQIGLPLEQSPDINGRSYIEVIQYQFPARLLEVGKRYIVAVSITSPSSTGINMGNEVVRPDRRTGFRGAGTAQANATAPTSSPTDGTQWGVGGTNPYSVGILLQI